MDIILNELKKEKVSYSQYYNRLIKKHSINKRYAKKILELADEIVIFEQCFRLKITDNFKIDFSEPLLEDDLNRIKKTFRRLFQLKRLCNLSKKVFIQIVSNARDIALCNFHIDWREDCEAKNNIYQLSIIEMDFFRLKPEKEFRNGKYYF